MTAARLARGTPIIGIAGWKNSGKTTLTVRLVEECRRRGLRVATIKHAHHSFDVDPGQTDSARHRRAGAGQVAIVSSRRWALMTELEAGAEPSLEEIVARLAPTDLIIVEGFKRAAIPKIETRRRGAAPGSLLATTDPLVIAIATDEPEAHSGSVAVFHLDDIAALADFILAAAVCQPPLTT